MARLKLKLFLLLFLVFPLLAKGQRYQVRWVSPEGKEERVVGDSLRVIGIADSVLKNFQEKGYLEAELQREVKIDTLYIRLHSGPKYSWKNLDIEQVSGRYLTQLGLPSKEYKKGFEWMDNLLEEAENRGYPFASARLDSLVIEPPLLSGKVVFEEGPLILWDSVEVGANAKTKKSYLQLLSGLSLGEAFSQSELERSIKRLQRSPYFTLAGRPELSFQNRSAIATYPIRERRLNVFDGVIGFLPNENESGKLLITGQVDLRLFHLGGKGRDFTLQWQKLNIQSQSLDVGFKESFVFRSKLDVGGNFSLLKQDSSFMNRTFTLDFGYQIADSGYLKFFTKRQAGDLIGASEPDLTELPEAIDYRWNQYGLAAVWDSLDDLVFPRRGFRVQGQFSVGNKKIIQNTGIPEELYEGLEESTVQLQGTIDLEKHVFVSPSWGMWFRGAGGFLQNEHLFVNEFFRLGGLKSIRGFNEKFFFARSYGYLSIEQRLYFGENTYLMVFSDVGSMDNPYNSPKKDHPVSIGTGINLDTGGGLFSFVFALGKSNIQPLAFEYARIHFGYLARF